MDILTSAKRFFAGTLLSRLSGLLRDIAMAICFGVTPEVAAFMVSYRLAWMGGALPRSFPLQVLHLATLSSIYLIGLGAMIWSLGLTEYRKLLTVRAKME